MYEVQRMHEGQAVKYLENNKQYQKRCWKGRYDPNHVSCKAELNACYFESMRSYDQ